jgi:hypothetical protein
MLIDLLNCHAGGPLRIPWPHIVRPVASPDRNRRWARRVELSVRRLVLLAVFVLVVTGCGRPAAPNGQPSAVGASSASDSPQPTAGGTRPPSPPSRTESSTARVWQLRYVLLDHYRDFAYCDPDLYPVARGDEQSHADEWWANTDHGLPEASTILAHLGYREPLSAQQRLTGYQDHKKLNVIVMRAVSGGYEYQLSTSKARDQPDQTVDGVVTADGKVHERSRRNRPGGCPICLDPETRIATPGGDMPATDVRPGDLVWTVDGDGHRVAAPVRQVVRRQTPGPHLLLRLALSDGRALVAAGAHPAADGTALQQLRPGQRYDGATIAALGWVPSTAPVTVDILPAGPTGNYWANGILVGSTLRW